MNTDESKTQDEESIVGVFEVEQIDNTVVLTPTEDMGELNSQSIAEGLQDVQDHLKETDFQHVVLDFQRTDYFGSTVIGEFIHLWQEVRARDGRMALCGLSPHEKAILKTTRLDDRWLVCGSRDEALASVGRQGEQSRTS